MNTLLQNAAEYALNFGVESVCKRMKDRPDIGDDSDSESASNSPASRYDDDKRVTLYSSYQIGCPIAANEAFNLPTLDQLDQFVDCLKTFHPFVNNLLIVQDHHHFEDCWYSMCSDLIDWKRKQCHGFHNMIKRCSITGPLRFHEFYSHLKDTENYIFHETAGIFVKFVLSKISDLKNEYPKFKLH